ncbi:MAG: hypothetical protein WC614_06195 [bacterium]
MKNKIKYLLFLFILGILVTGCGDKPAPPNDTYNLGGDVWWGTNKVANTLVEMTRWMSNDTTIPDGAHIKIDTSVTASSSSYLGSYDFWYFCYENDNGYGLDMQYKVRAKDSTNAWSSFQVGSIKPNGNVTVDFHL